LSNSGNPQPSELAQALNLLTWLDEEHRKDRAEIARLHQRLESQATEISEQARRTQELESRLTGLQAQQARLPEFSRGVELLKKELMNVVDNLEEERRRADREAARLRLSDVEAQSRVVADLRKRVDVLPEFADKLENRYAEDRRLSQEVVGLREKVVEMSKTVGDWPRRAAYLDEQRTQDAKRISQLQQEVSELFKRLEPYPGRFEMLDEQLRRFSGEVGELRSSHLQAIDKQTQMSDRYLNDFAETRRQINDWAESLSGHEQQMERYSKEMRVFREAHDESRRTLENLSQLDERLVRESRQVAEAQRVAEERQRRELQSWQEENQKHWARHEMESARLFAEIQNRLEDLSERLGDVTAGLDAMHPEVERIWRALDEDSEARLAAARDRRIAVSRQREAQQVK